MTCILMWNSQQYNSSSGFVLCFDPAAAVGGTSDRKAFLLTRAL